MKKFEHKRTKHVGYDANVARFWTTLTFRFRRKPHIKEGRFMLLMTTRDSKCAASGFCCKSKDFGLCILYWMAKFKKSKVENFGIFRYGMFEKLLYPKTMQRPMMLVDAVLDILKHKLWACSNDVASSQHCGHIACGFRFAFLHQSTRGLHLQWTKKPTVYPWCTLHRVGICLDNLHGDCSGSKGFMNRTSPFSDPSEPAWCPPQDPTWNVHFTTRVSLFVIFPSLRDGDFLTVAIKTAEISRMQVGVSDAVCAPAMTGILQDAF